MRYVNLTGNEWEMYLSVREYVNDDLGEIRFLLRTKEGATFEFLGGTCREFSTGMKPDKRTQDASVALFAPPKPLNYRPEDDEMGRGTGGRR